MSASLDQRYFDWLYSLVSSVRRQNPSSTYRELFHILFTKEVVWMVPNDDNRLEDGRSLRYEFLDSENVRLAPADDLWMDLECSFLEFLIGIARRCAFETDSDTAEWFWELLRNLKLDRKHDRARINREEINEVLDRVIWRTYKYDGSGGLFPLDVPDKDQREVEIWYQLNAYILERSLS